MSSVLPGIKARHMIVSDACREGKGDQEALDEALKLLGQEYSALLRCWPVGKNARFHFVLTVEYPRK